MNALIQTANGSALPLLFLTRHWHSTLCQLNDLEFRWTISPAFFTDARKNKIAAIIDWANSAQPGDCGFYADADVLWADATFNPCKLLPPNVDIGMVRNTMGLLNAGAMYMRTGPALWAVLDEWRRIASMPLSEAFQSGLGMDDQEQCNGVIERLKMPYVELNSRFNHYRWARGAPDGPIVVKAWHGEPRGCVARRMITAMGTLGQDVRNAANIHVQNRPS